MSDGEVRHGGRMAAALSRFLRRGAGAAALFAASLGGVMQANAAPARVTLKLEGVSLVQGAAALSRASGVSLEVPDTLRQAPVAGGTATRTSFEWSGMSFPAALRQLCTRFGVVPLTSPDGYRLVPEPPAWKRAFPMRVQEQEHAGVRLYLANAGWGRSGRIRIDDKVRGGEPTLTLTFMLLLGERDRDTISGLRHVVARDDQGRVLKQLGPSGFPQRFYSDEWAQTITLQAPSAGAKRIVSLEGELLVHGTSRRRSHEAKVPLRGRPTRVSADGATIEVEPPQPIPARAEDGPGYQVRASLRVPPDASLKPEIDSVSFQVLDAQGKPLPRSPVPAEESDRDGPLYFTRTRRYGPTQSGPARVRVSWREQSPLQPLFTFRMAEIPLPTRP